MSQGPEPEGVFTPEPRTSIVRYDQGLRAQGSFPGPRLPEFSPGGSPADIRDAINNESLMGPASGIRRDSAQKTRVTNPAGSLRPGESAIIINAAMASEDSTERQPMPFEGEGTTSPSDELKAANVNVPAAGEPIRTEVPLTDNRDRKILDPHEKPFIFILSGHRKNDIPSLQPWKQQLEELFRTNPTGKVVVLVEAANLTKEASDFFRNAVTRGMTMSQARREAQDLGLYTPGPPNEYNDARDSILDDMNATYPGRLDLVTEWGAEERVAAEPAPYLYSYTPGQETWDEAVSNSIANAHTKAEFHTEREIQIAQIVRDALAQDDVIGGTGLLGSYHTQIGHALRKDGYTSSRLLPDKQGRTYYYSPTDTLNRRARFFPDKEITSGDIEIHVGAQVGVNENLSPDSSPAEEQAEYRDAHKWIREIEKSRQKKEGNS